MDSWHALVGIGHDPTTLQTCARAVIIFVYGFLLVRLAGRRVFGKWAALDIIVSIVIGSNLSRAMTGSADLIDALVASTLLVALHFLLSQVAARSARLSRIIEGRGIDIAVDGQLDRAVAQRHSVSRADIDEALRQRGIAGLAETGRVTLEPSGAITALPPDRCETRRNDASF